MFLVLGPASLAAYLVRARTVWVTLDADGMGISGGRTVPWGDIREVRRRRPLLRRDSGPAHVSEFNRDVLEHAPGCISLDSGCLSGLGELLVGLMLVLAFAFAVWLIFFVLVPLLLIPVLEVFIPFGDLIQIRTGGRTLVLRDLSDADDFMTRIGPHVRVSLD
ncbi:MAG TPA: hypothetical protein VKW04_12815 [Planctomycetota bacterium]|nr:hypothetical protein [Planctomycetota bacterium]